jgi:uncharacterized protein (DUF2062 family)
LAWWKGTKRKLRRAQVRLLRSPGAPAEIAGGMAVGLFVAFMPIMGLQTPMAFAAAEALRRLSRFQVSRIAAAAGSWIVNPVTAAPLYGLCYLIGRPVAFLLLPAPQHMENRASVVLDLELLSGPEALEVLLSLALGGVLLGFPVAWVGYRLTYGMVVRQHARREGRRARRARHAERMGPGPGAAVAPVAPHPTLASRQGGC